ncbi:hypothetical protein B7494_g5582 [Chlorociboria aeruginascens]|nr:hypothetical protein B7494_g5582 [Chlorociboria aeruginascens]
MGGHIDCYLDCSSLYSYFTLVHLQKNREVLATHDVTVDFIPVFLGGINQGSGNKPPWSLPAKAKYGKFDSGRAKHYFGLGDISVPDFFPPVTLIALLIPPQIDITQPPILSSHLNSTKLFSEKEVEEIIAATGKKEWKDKLLENTKKVLDQGAFGAPWMWVRNHEGKEEPFFAMPGGKRKFDNFDPNKSDSDDVDFEPGEDRPRKSAKKSSRKKSTGGARKRTKYRGSDVSDDDDVEDSLLEQSFSDEEEEEDIEMNAITGRAVRKAAKKAVNYEEDSNSDIADLVDDGEIDEVPTKRQPKRSRGATAESDTPKKRPSRVVTLKISTPIQRTRTTRAGSSAPIRTGNTEPLSAGTRRSTRARTEEGEEPIALSNSGRHVVRASRSPEPIGRSRATRGSKGMKQPASTIKEEVHESSSYEQGEPEDTTMATVIAGTDEADDGAENLDDEDAPAEEDADELAADAEGDQVAEADDEEEDDDIPIMRTRGSRKSNAGLPDEEAGAEVEAEAEPAAPSRRLTRGSKSKQRKTSDEASSDFEPPDEASEEEISASDGSPKKSKDDDYESSPVRRGRSGAAPKSKSNSRKRSAQATDEEDELDHDELAEEIQDLKADGRQRRRILRDPEIAYEPSRRQRKPVDYSIKPMDQIYAADEDAEDAAPTPTRRARGGRNGASQPWERNLYSTYGPFGGGGGPAPVIGGPWGTGAIGGVDSDSSDDETMQRPHVTGNVGMTPTTAMAPGLLPGLAQTNNTDAMAAMAGTPANLGKVKSQKALADADPLGVDQNVDFSKVGGLEGHIDQLKEMVQMPLLYPELFLKFHVTPPRGVLFHGPPGTGKTLLARALAASIGSGGRKITFYMRKGADALSKWVGEAERQLRLLFEEARKTQPSIIFFDEIDGLAPVRSSKQEQIHASIVSTLLALMDGMDGRGQVIVIGATNRPDNIDPALRRPGRFDREFYFPLPDLDGRKAIINIHTKDWGIDDAFKTSLAHITKGYGGADLRALCTEAALNSIQRTYPQIYSSNDKLKIDADKIKITAKDFMLSIKKMIPSSERSTSSGAKPLPKSIEPLLIDQLMELETILDELIPIKKKTTALQEAMYEQYEDDDFGFRRETLQQEFEKSRVFRPRLLIGGEPGMGQAYLGAAILNHFEGLHVQSFDLPTIYSDSARSAEAAIVQLFAEVKRHTPSVIFLPGIDTWYHTLSEAVITTFLGLLKAIPPTDPILVLGITDTAPDKVNADMLRNLFGYSRNNRFAIKRPSLESRKEFFSNVTSYIRKEPKDFPEPLKRKKRKLEVLEIAPPPTPKPPTKEEIKALKKRDHQLLNLLKIQIQPIMDQIQRKYRKFRAPAIPQNQIQYLYEELDPNFVRPDVPQFRPYELDVDKEGIKGLRETASGKFFYNLETTTIEERLSNGFYARPKDFVADIRSLARDAKHMGDKDRTLRANELLANVEVDLATIEASPAFADCENVYQRQLQRAKEKEEKYQKRHREEIDFAPVRSDVPSGLNSEDQSSGPLRLGESIPGLASIVARNPAPKALSNGHSGHNGTPVSPHKAGEDVQMSGTDEANTQNTTEESQGLVPPNQQWPRMPSGPSNLSNHATVNTGISQRSAFQEISHSTSPRALLNDASSTTSGKKTSEGWNTQATNGIHPESSSPMDRPGNDSETADTQDLSQRDSGHTGGTQGEVSSGDQWPHSQAHGLARGNLVQTYASQTPSSGEQNNSQNPPVPLFDQARVAPSRSKAPHSMANLLNNSPVEATSSQISSQKDNIINDEFVDKVLRHLVTGSSGCSIEQLEQINRELMDTVWKMRGEYNRDLVGYALITVFNEVIQDMEEMQRILQSSQSQAEGFLG